ncbi:L-threonylcarbamoyladenylate synthase [Dysgonomonas sp. Marseille-Q5470]|jgi:translation factor SUA5|uniref:L-threonylcarbamoyladenylate synthase n=1 Tax=Dysgonomonas sp. Marseille-Q5470 TaxID=3039494 RepID=UPI0024BC9103|nr:L-threonylcarbamoyladenylate synthase [Dysgonomonas sp. Marseille-Q5470]MBS5979201.1 threonylcarbamoyl-AMP synthase [Dysgonomonas mossii]
MEEDIKKAFEVLVSGGLILYPTDTIWGIGCDATNEEAVHRVYELKRRVDSKALITLLDNPIKLDYYIDEVPSLAWDLIELSEKPLTIIYDGARNVAPNLMAEDGSLAIRVTKEKFSQELCKRFRKALVSTSANISGEPAPANFDDISEEIKLGVDYIVKYRQEDTSKSKASSIIKLGKTGEVKIIRE